MKLDEQYTIKGVRITVRREDQRYKPPLPPHGKMGMLDMLCKDAKENGYKMIGCFGSKYSNWITGLPILASKHGLKSIVCYPANNFDGCPEWLQKVTKNLHSLISKPKGYQLHLLRPNMVTINMAQAKKYVEDKGGYFVPFGFDSPETVENLSKQLAMPKEIGTLVLSCGSGITLAAVLRSIRRNRNKVRRIEAVSSGRAIASIVKTVERHELIGTNVTWRSIHEYADVPNIKCPWPAHSHFELKAYDWMVRNIKRLILPIYFINIGADS